MQPRDRLKESPSQTAGPYIHIGTTPNLSGITGIYAEDLGSSPIKPETRGARIVLTGRIFDGLETPVKDALVEIWQADASGRYPGRGDPRGPADPNVTGWGRQAVDAETGMYRFETIKPGRVPFPDGRLMAPHVTFWVVARGINTGLHTRLYFADDKVANDEDPVLQRIEHRNRVPTLIATPAIIDTIATYTFDIHLQGASETVFFDV